jgi:hypothetical protein
MLSTTNTPQFIFLSTIVACGVLRDDEEPVTKGVFCGTCLKTPPASIRVSTTPHDGSVLNNE